MNCEVNIDRALQESCTDIESSHQEIALLHESFYMKNITTDSCRSVGVARAPEYPLGKCLHSQYSKAKHQCLIIINGIYQESK